MDKIIYGLGESTGSGDFQWKNSQDSPAKASDISLLDNDKNNSQELVLPASAADDREKLEIIPAPAPNRCGTYTIYDAKNDLSQSSESSTTSSSEILCDSKENDSKPQPSYDFDGLLSDQKNVNNLLIFDPIFKHSKSSSKPQQLELDLQIESYEKLLKSPTNTKISSGSNTKNAEQKSGAILISHYDLSGCYKKFGKKIRSKFGKLFQINPETPIKDKILKKSSSIIIAGIVESLSKENIQVVRDFVQNSGGSLLVLCNGNSSNSLTTDKKAPSSGSGQNLKVLKSINELLQNFGLKIRNDSVIRATMLNNFHPKECLIEDALNCPGILTKYLPLIGGKIPEKPEDTKDAQSSDEDDGEENEGNEVENEAKENLTVVYPFGSTIVILDREKARAFMSSGITSFPTSKPLGAISLDGKIIVLGTGQCFKENYVDLEDNEKFLEFLLCLLSANDLSINEEQFIDIGISENHQISSNTVQSCEQLRVVMSRKDSLLIPGAMSSTGEINRFKIVENKFFGVRNSAYLGQIIKTRKEIGLEDEMKLGYTIKPIFQTPLPSIKMALYDPVFRTLPPPALELFDLDAEFAHPSKKICKIASKCEDDDDDLEYFVQSIGDILDINRNIMDIHQKENQAEIDSKTIVYKLATHIMDKKGC